MAWLEEAGISHKFTDPVGLTGENGWAENLKEGALGENQQHQLYPTMKGTLGGPEAGLALQSRDMQGEYGNLLRAQMRGRGPSVARMQLAQGRDAAIRGALASAASARGTNAALAGRSAAQSAGRVGQQSARDASLLRAQEQLSAQQQFGNLAQAMRGQDIQSRGLTSAEEQARLNAQVAYMNAQTKISEGEAERRQQTYGGLIKMGGSLLGLSDVRMKDNVQPVGYGRNELQALGPQQMGTPWAGTNQAAQMTGMDLDPSKQYLNRGSSLTAMNTAEEQAGKPGGGGMDLSGLPGMNFGGGGGGGLPFSDPVTKSNMHPAGSGLVRAAAQAQPVQFQYKPEAAAMQDVSTQPRVGMPANGGPGSLEQNPVYGPAVEYGPDGLARVNAGQATMANIAVTSDLAKGQQSQEQRLANLENVMMKGKSPKSKAGGMTKASLTDSGDEEQLANTTRRIRNEQTPRGQFPGQGRPLDDPEAHNAALAEADWKANNLAMALQDRQAQQRHKQVQAYGSQVNSELQRRRAPGGMQSVGDEPWVHVVPGPPREAVYTEGLPPDANLGAPTLGQRKYMQDPSQYEEAPTLGYAPIVSGFDKREKGYGALEDQSSENRTWRLDDVYVGKDNEMYSVEAPFGDAAAAYNEAGKNISKKHTAIRDAAGALSGGNRPDPSPNLVYQMLKQRGVKTSLKEVKAAMADDQAL